MPELWHISTFVENKGAVWARKVRFDSGNIFLCSVNFPNPFLLGHMTFMTQTANPFVQQMVEFLRLYIYQTVFHICFASSTCKYRLALSLDSSGAIAAHEFGHVGDGYTVKIADDAVLQAACCDCKFERGLLVLVMI